MVMIGKTSDFLSNYLLLMPVQGAVMTFYSSSTAYVNIMQLMYYKRRDMKAEKEGKLAVGWNIFFLAVIGLCVLLIVALTLALLWRTQSFISLACPTSLIVALLGCYLIVKASKKEGEYQMIEKEPKEQ
jgi:peptidoglycan biosynthesis protein MviN/MurJ (putative lipid II flippase)